MPKSQTSVQACHQFGKNPQKVCYFLFDFTGYLYPLVPCDSSLLSFFTEKRREEIQSRNLVFTKFVKRPSYLLRRYLIELWSASKLVL